MCSSDLRYFLARYAARYQRPRSGFSEEAIQSLRAFDWPGNVRELDHAIERAVLLSQGEQLESWDLALQRPGQPGDPVAPGPRSLDDMERDAIREALARFDGNVSLAAKALGVSRSALYRRLQRYGISAS